MFMTATPSRTARCPWTAFRPRRLIGAQTAVAVATPCRQSRGCGGLLRSRAGRNTSRPSSHTRRRTRAALSARNTRCCPNMFGPSVTRSKWPTTRATLRDWVLSIGLEPSAHGTHSMRRTKVARVYKKTDNLRAVQLLLGHTKWTALFAILASTWTMRCPCLKGSICNNPADRRA